MKVKVSIIYVYYNTPDEIVESIGSLKDALGKISHEIIIVDNNSTKKLPQSVRREKKFKIITLEKNIGYGAGANRGANRALGKYLLVVNPDVIFHKDAISRLVRKMEKDKRIGLIGPKQVNATMEVLPGVSGYPVLPGALFAFTVLDKLFPENRFSKKYWKRDFDYDEEKRVPVIGGACLLFQKEAFRKIDGFDEQFFMYFEEADIAFRMKKLHYFVVYFPKAVITHLIGRSLSDKNHIQKMYEESRFRFFKKYQGLLPAFFGEAAIRLLQAPTITLISILLISLFLNLFKIDKYIMFYGDFGRDLFVARDMLLTGAIPLLGIPSSVVWLHQGPLSIYFIGIALFFGNYNPVSPAVLYALLGVGSTFLVYKIGKDLFAEKIGLLSAAMYATSPVIIINAREPYHTAPIPFFSLLFFLAFWQVLKGKKQYVFVLFFFLGLLLQLELSNVVILFALIITWWYYKLKISRQIFLQGLLGFGSGILPFILHDLTHNFIQIGGLFLWTINRVRLFFGLTTSGNATTQEAGNALVTVWAETVRAIYPLSPTIVAAILFGFVFLLLVNVGALLNRKRVSGFLVISLWLGVSVIGYIVHARPGSAYFPVIYPAIILLASYVLYKSYTKIKVLIVFIVIMIIFNAYYLLINNYFLITPRSKTVPLLYGYGYGLSMELQNNVIDAIINDAKGRPFAIEGGGFLKDFTTSVDNYKYLAVWKKAKLKDDAVMQYIIYQEPQEITTGSVIFQNKFVTVLKK